MSLLTIGLNSWSESQNEHHLREGWQVARVIAVHRNMLVIHDGSREIKAELSGRLHFLAESPGDLPTVGDWVSVQILDEGEFAVIDVVMPRRSVVARKAAGDRVEEQLIAANVDVAFIVQACDNDFNLRRLERYLVAVRSGNVRPILLLSKSDVISDEEQSELIGQVQSIEPFLPIVLFSNNVSEGWAAVDSLLEPGKTHCLLGSSGVGKSTLVNRLVGSERLKTSDIRESDGKGRHTTTSRQLIVLESGAILIDTPGMREFGAMGVDAGVSETFSDIEELGTHCRFSDCSHTVEKGCALIHAVETGTLESLRLTSYLKLQRESARNEMSLAERRKKEKSQGKFYKSVIQGKKDRR